MKLKLRSRTIAAATVGAIVMVLAGCGGDEGDSGTAAGTMNHG